MRKNKRRDIEQIFIAEKEKIIPLVKILMKIAYNPNLKYTKEELDDFKESIRLSNLQIPYKSSKCFPVSMEFRSMQEKIFSFLI